MLTALDNLVNTAESVQELHRTPLILLLDDFHHLATLPDYEDTLKLLSYLADKRMSLVIAGASLIEDPNSKTSPLSLKLVNVRIGVFSDEETALLIDSPTRSELPREIVDTVHLEAGGHPSILQYLMSRLWCANLMTISQSDVDHAVRSFLSDRSTLLKWYFTQLSPFERELLGYFVETESLSTEDAMRLEPTLPPWEVDDALAKLVSLGLLKHVHDHDHWHNRSYMVTGQVVRRYWQTTVTSQGSNTHFTQLKESIMPQPDLVKYGRQMERFFGAFRDDVVQHDQFPRIYGQTHEMAELTDELNRVIGNLRLNLQAEETARKDWEQKGIQVFHEQQLMALNALATNTVAGETLWMSIRPRLLTATEQVQAQIESGELQPQVQEPQDLPLPEGAEAENLQSLSERLMDGLKKVRDFLSIGVTIGALAAQYKPFIDGAKDVLNILKLFVAP